MSSLKTQLLLKLHNIKGKDLARQEKLYLFNKYLLNIEDNEITPVYDFLLAAINKIEEQQQNTFQENSDIQKGQNKNLQQENQKKQQDIDFYFQPKTIQQNKCQEIQKNILEQKLSIQDKKQEELNFKMYLTENFITQNKSFLEENQKILDFIEKKNNQYLSYNISQKKEIIEQIKQDYVNNEQFSQINKNLILSSLIIQIDSDVSQIKVIENLIQQQQANRQLFDKDLLAKLSQHQEELKMSIIQDFQRNEHLILELEEQEKIYENLLKRIQHHLAEQQPSTHKKILQSIQFEMDLDGKQQLLLHLKQMNAELEVENQEINELKEDAQEQVLHYQMEEDREIMEMVQEKIKQNMNILKSVKENKIQNGDFILQNIIKPMEDIVKNLPVIDNSNEAFLYFVEDLKNINEQYLGATSYNRQDNLKIEMKEKDCNFLLNQVQAQGLKQFLDQEVLPTNYDIQKNNPDDNDQINQLYLKYQEKIKKEIVNKGKQIQEIGSIYQDKSLNLEENIDKEQEQLKQTQKLLNTYSQQPGYCFLNQIQFNNMQTFQDKINELFQFEKK